MIRISGFLLGVVLVLTTFLLILKPADTRPPGIRVTTEAMEAVREHGNPWPGGGETERNDPEMHSLGAGAEDRAEAVVSGAQITEQAMQPDDVSAGVASLHDQASTTETRSRYLFWSPFRSEWAAQGFAGRLANATGVPVEVIASGSGEYRVGFGYLDALELRERIDQIESITGLQLE